MPQPEHDSCDDDLGGTKDAGTIQMAQPRPVEHEEEQRTAAGNQGEVHHDAGHSQWETRRQIVYVAINSEYRNAVWRAGTNPNWRANVNQNQKRWVKTTQIYYNPSENTKYQPQMKLGGRSNMTLKTMTTRGKTNKMARRRGGEKRKPHKKTLTEQTHP